MKTSAPASRQRLRFSLRSRRKKEGVVRGKLRIRSVPGAFLVLGVLVVVVGAALAVAGYWPYRTPQLPVDPGEEGASGWAPKALLSAASLIHSERMKLLGPVIMGVGLFVLICANTVLYENRDRETQMLLAQMRSVICSVSAAVPSADLVRAGHYQWVGSLPAAHLNILCLQEMSISEPLLQVKSEEEEVLHHRDSSSTVQSAVSNREPAATPAPPTQSGLHRSISASSVSTLGGEGSGVFPPPLRRSYSAGQRTKCARPVPRLLPAEVRVDMAAAGEQKHRSWPRLDLGCARRYLKLDNKEDSVEKLLDQLEQQCSQLDASYGSGPFQ